jgi:hypothetical protein
MKTIIKRYWPSAFFAVWGVIFSSLAIFAAEGFAIFWFSALAVVSFVEAYALWDAARDDTLSETVWRYTKPLWVRLLLLVFMSWLLVHFVFQNPWS